MARSYRTIDWLIHKPKKAPKSAFLPNEQPKEQCMEISLEEGSWAKKKKKVQICILYNLDHYFCSHITWP